MAEQGRLPTALLLQLRRLTSQDLERVRHFIAALGTDDQGEMPAAAPSATPKEGAVWYRQERVRCGKQACRKCAAGEGHGPYWYAYFRKGGRMKSRYIGKHKPGE